MKLTIQSVIAVLFIQLIVPACSKQDGSVVGQLSPMTAGTRVYAKQNQKIISSADADVQNGRFNIQLPPGTYDISVAFPNAPFPLMFPAVVVQEGKTTDLSLIELPAESTGKGSLSGRITPAVAGAKMTLYAQGMERASVSTDNQGQFVFTEIPTGDYTVHANAPYFGKESAALTLSQNHTVMRNIALLYQAPNDNIDWAAGKIRVTGFGQPPANAVNMTISREMAHRAALADAQRKLVKTIAELKVGPDESLKSRMGEKNFSQKIQGYIQGYKIVAERELNGGKIEIDVELPLTGQDGLSRYLAE